MRVAVGGQDGEIGLPTEAVVEGGQKVGRRFVRAPRVLEPAGADLGVGPAMDAALRAVRGTQTPVVAQVAVVAEREPAGRVVERLGIGERERREA